MGHTGVATCPGSRVMSQVLARATISIKDDRAILGMDMGCYKGIIQWPYYTPDIYIYIYMMHVFYCGLLKIPDGSSYEVCRGTYN